MNENFVDITKSGEEIQDMVGGRVGVWSKDSKVFVHAVTESNQAVELSPAEAKSLANVLLMFVKQMENE